MTQKLEAFRSLVAGVLALLSGGCSASMCPSDGPEYYAALADLQWKFPQYNYLSIWVSHTYEEAHWRPLLNDEQKAIDGLRAKSATFTDKCYQHQYRGWLDYYQNGLNSAWKELKGKANKREMDRYEDEEHARRKMIEEYRRRNGAAAVK